MYNVYNEDIVAGEKHESHMYIDKNIGSNRDMGIEWEEPQVTWRALPFRGIKHVRFSKVFFFNLGEVTIGRIDENREFQG